MKIWILGLGFLLQVSGTLVAREALQFVCSSQPSVAYGAEFEIKAQMQGRVEDIGAGRRILTHTTRFSSPCPKSASRCKESQEIQEVGLAHSLDYKPVVYKSYNSFALVTDLKSNPQRLRFLLPERVASDLNQDFQAMLIFSDWKGRGGASVPMACKADIVASEASEFMDTAEEEVKRAQAVISSDFGLGQLQLKVSPKALQEQIKAARTCQSERCVSFSQATQLALAEVFASQEYAETPLEIALTEVPREPGAWNSSEVRKAAARELLRDAIDRSQTRFSLYTGDEAPELALPPEQGEDAHKNWIFSLYVPSLSDHFYWVIVDKAGRKKPYVYGFN